MKRTIAAIAIALPIAAYAAIPPGDELENCRVEARTKLARFVATLRVEAPLEAWPVTLIAVAQAEREIASWTGLDGLDRCAKFLRSWQPPPREPTIGAATAKPAMRSHQRRSSASSASASEIKNTSGVGAISRSAGRGIMRPTSVGSKRTWRPRRESDTTRRLTHGETVSEKVCLERRAGRFRVQALEGSPGHALVLAGACDRAHLGLHRQDQDPAHALPAGCDSHAAPGCRRLSLGHRAGRRGRHRGGAQVAPQRQGARG